MTSPFSNAAPGYREQGLAVMPCGPRTKFPGRYTAADGWWRANEWQKYCDRLPTGFEMQVWTGWPDAGICLALGASSAPRGKILVAVDIDTDDPNEVAAIRSVLPGSPVIKRGAKGETQFYLANPCVKNQPFNDGNKRRILDLLAHGRQTVLPPTIHPDTGAAYYWVTPDTFEHFDVADLPQLPDDIAEQLGAALAPFGFQPPIVLGEAGTADLGIEAPHRALNDAALANLDAWVPGLNLYKAKKVGGGYKAVADWRPSSSGRPNAKRATNLAIRHDGIKDCGENRGYTPIDLVMHACECDLETAFRYLQEKVAPSTPMLIVSNREPEREAAAENPILSKPKPKSTIPPRDEPEEPAIVRTSPKGNLMGLALATLDGERVGNLPAIAPAPVPAATLIPASLCTPPGLLGDVVRWMNDSDETPAPQLNLGAAIAFMGAIIGRRFAHPSRSARSNFYCVGVAPTGFGKAHAILATKELARRTGVERYLGPGRWKSESAVRGILEEKPSVCCLVDELGGVFRDVLGKKASEHRAGIRDIMLELFSSANTTYTGSEGAAAKAVSILNPNFCVYGASTPTDLWANVTSGAAADGFLPRWLIFDAGKTPAEEREAKADVFSPPDTLRRAIHELLDVKPKGNLNGVTSTDPIMAEWGAGAREFFKEMRQQKNREIFAANELDRISTAMVLSRFAEHCAKLSLIYAVGLSPFNPVISVSSLQWAEGVVRHSAAALINALEGRVADNDRHAEYKTVLNHIRGAGPNGLTEKALERLVDGRIETRRYEDILGQLLRAGRVWRGLRSGPKGGRPVQRLIPLAEDDDEREAG